MAFIGNIYKDVKEGLYFNNLNFEQAVELEKTARELIVLGNNLMGKIVFHIELGVHEYALKPDQIKDGLYWIKLLSDAMALLPVSCIQNRDFNLLFRDVDFLYRTCIFIKQGLPDDYKLARFQLTKMLDLLNKYS